jgi:histidine triad (HIT) family protein
VFCDIIAGRAPGIMATRWEDVVTIEPLNPVTPGHVLVVPRRHVRDAKENEWVTADVMRRVAQYLKYGPYPDVQPIGPANIITSCGAEATQTVFHLHVHVIPRRAGDGLKLPWSES